MGQWLLNGLRDRDEKHRNRKIDVSRSLPSVSAIINTYTTKYTIAAHNLLVTEAVDAVLLHISVVTYIMENSIHPVPLSNNSERTGEIKTWLATWAIKLRPWNFVSKPECCHQYVCVSKHLCTHENRKILIWCRDKLIWIRNYTDG